MRQAHARVDFSIPAMRAWRKLPEETRAEVINGNLYVLSSPTLYHSRVSANLAFELTSYVRRNNLGEVFFTPVGTFLKDGTNVVIPDIVFVSKDNGLQFDKRGLFGVPDLHIEIVSPGTRHRDLTVKKKLYEEAGVKEYWVVDPVTREAWGYLLDNGRYDEPFSMHSKIYVRLLNKIFRF